MSYHRTPRWDVPGGNLPFVNIMDFIVHPRDRVLVIATHGRRVWAIDVGQIKGRENSAAADDTIRHVST